MQLPLTDNERTFLRKGRIKIADLVHYSVEELSEILRCEEERARKLIGLAVFQQVPSIGRIGAAMMVDELKSQDAVNLLDSLEQKMGYRVDPCVEDQLRCMIYYAHYPESERSWPDFTQERKEYRSKNGYPTNRPSSSHSGKGENQ